MAFGALFGWGIGDFFIQRSTRLVGAIKTLFFIGLAGFVFLLPFVWRDLLPVFSSGGDYMMLLLGVALVMIVAPINFEALKRGKIAIVEPIIGSELVITLAVGLLILKEPLTWAQIGLVLAVFLGIAFAVTGDHSILKYKRGTFEAGVFLAGLTAIGLAASNILVGLNSRATSPYLTIWFVHTGAAICCFLWLFFDGRWRELHRDLKRNMLPILGASFFDTGAWLSFALATTFIPISLAAAISSGYVVLAGLLGVLVTRERLKRHQAFGAGLAIAAEVMLAAISR